MLNRYQVTSLFLAVMVASCGGGGSGPSASGGGIATSVGGKLFDGYIYGAKVCLDITPNLVCDPDEPSDITKPDGSYSIAYDGSKGPASKFVVIAEVGPQTYDQDDKVGDKWVSQSEAGKSPFNLAAPVTSSNMVVSPLTTLVTHELLSDKGAGITEDSIQTAQNSVKTKMGLKSDLMTLDFVKDKDQKMQQLAQVISVALGETAKNMDAELKKQGAPSMVSDENKKAIQIAIATTVLDKVVPAVIDKSTGELNQSSVDEAKKVAKTNAASVITGVVNNIIAGTKAGESVVTDVKSAMKAGVVIASYENSFFLMDATKPYGLGAYINSKRMRAEFSQYDLDAKTGKGVDRVYYQGDWVATARWGTDYALTKSGTWVPDDFFSVHGNLTTNLNCVVGTRTNDVEAVTNFCLVEKDLSGKGIKDINPDYCNPVSGFTPPSGCSTAKYKSGSKGYDVTVSVTADRYTINVPVDPTQTWHYGQSFGGNATTIPGFLTLLKANINNAQTIGIWSNYAIRLKSFDESKSQGVLAWTYTDPDSKIKSDAGTSSFKMVTVKNVPMLVFNPAPDYHQRNPGDMVGSDFVFAAKDGKIRMGTVDYANVKQQINFGASGWIGNTSAFDSVLEGLGLKAYPYGAATSGGGGGAGAVTSNQNSAEGLWGPAQANGAIASVAILDNQELWGFSRNGSGDPTAAYYGHINSSNGSISGDVVTFDLINLRVSSMASVTGTYSPKSTLTVDATNSAPNGAVALTYINIYDSAAPMALAAGTYSMSGKTLEGNVGAFDLTVGADGRFTSTSGSCSVTGSIAPRASGKAVFDLNLMGTSGCGTTLSQYLNGMAFVDTSVSPVTVTTIASNADKNTILVLRGVKK
jgi:hypothetical protein